MTKTYTLRHDLYIRIEAETPAEAARMAAEMATAVRATLPPGATLSQSRVLQR